MGKIQSRIEKTSRALFVFINKHKRAFKLVLNSILIFTLIFSTFLLSSQKVKSATYTWTQSDWSGGEDQSAYAGHTDQVQNLNAWTKYYSKDKIDTSTSDQISLSTTSTLTFDKQSEFERAGYNYSDTTWNSTDSGVELTQQGRINSTGYYESPVIQGSIGNVDWSQISWDENLVKRASFRGFVDGNNVDAQDIQLADIDKDGDIDMVAVSFLQVPSTGLHAVMWYENNGTETYTAHIVATNPANVFTDDIRGAYELEIVDLNKDGELDIVVSVNTADKIVWYQNDGSENFTASNIITSVDAPRGFQVADIDKDNDLDIGIALEGDDDIAWWQNNGSMTFFLKTRADMNLDGAYDMAIGDLNGDTYDDFVGVGYFADRLCYYQNNTLGYFSGCNVLDQISSDPSFDGPVSSEIEDLDKDGDNDIIVATENGNSIYWYENDGSGNPTNFPKHTIDSSATNVNDFVIKDINLDGNLDILYANKGLNEVAWGENDGSENFSKHTITTKFNGPTGVAADDIDGDGDIDLVASSDQGSITWWENDFGSYKNVFNNITNPSDTPAFVNATDIFPVDLDKDNDVDIVAVSFGEGVNNGEIGWWENDGSQNFTKHIIVSSFNGGSSIWAGDMNGDTEIDIVAASSSTDKIIWLANDGSENFTSTDVITAYSAASDVILYDINKDTHLDILSTSKNSNSVDWFENDGSATPVFARHQLTTTFNGASSISAGDIDGDNDIDIIATAAFSDAVRWWENNGSNSFPTNHLVNTSGIFDGASSVYLGDFEGDTDLDIFASAADADTISYWLNDGTGNFGVKNDVTTTFENAGYVVAEDVDEDGDDDIVATSPGGSGIEGQVAWWINNSGTFEKRVVAKDATGASGISVFDIDKDENLDFSVAIKSGNKLIWYKNKQTFSDVKIQVRAGNNPGSLGNYKGPSGNEGDCSVTDVGLPYCFSDPAAGDISFLSDSEYFQFIIYFTTTGSAITAQVFDFTVEATGILGYELTGEMISNPFNAEDDSDVIADLFWSENNPSGTNVKAQIRTAPDNGSDQPGAWSDWLGPTNNSDYYDSATTNLINDDFNDSTDDQWIQIKMILESNVVTTPVLEDVSLKYVINAPPEITIVNSSPIPPGSSNPDCDNSPYVCEDEYGDVTILYEVYDPDITEDPGENNSDVFLYVDIGLTLNEELSKSDNVQIDISGANIAKLPNAGTLMVGSEIVEYSGKTANAVTGISRGAPGVGYHTKIEAHSTGAKIWMKAANASGSVNQNVQNDPSSPNKSIIWHVEDDLSNFYKDDSYLRVVGIDGNAAKQTGYAEIGPLELDTISPIYNLVTLNSRTDELDFDVSDDGGASQIQTVMSNNSDLSYDGTNPQSGSWFPYVTNRTWLPTDTDADGVETVYVRFKDIYGNLTSIYSITTPKTPENMLIQDISNPSNNDWRLFVSWSVIPDPTPGFSSYNVYRSEDVDNFEATAVQIGQVTDRLTNYYIDEGLDNTKTYYYRITASDILGNESNFNDVGSGDLQKEYASDLGLQPDGSGGGDFTPAVISNIQVTNITTNSATITWTTDKLANSTVGFSEDQSYDEEVGEPSMVTDHSITLDNLDENTQYYFKIKSSTIIGETTENENPGTNNFTTLIDTTPPVISNVLAVTSLDGAGITWSTNEPSTSQVEYGLTTSYGDITAIDNNLVYGHGVQLDSLNPNTPYHYRVRSKDANGNETVSGDYTFTTENIVTDSTPPTISNISITNITSNSADSSWETDEDAISWIEYGTSQSYGRGEITGTGTYKQDFDIDLLGLQADETFHYQIFAVDEKGNISQSSDATFTTEPDPNVDTEGNGGFENSGGSGTGAPIISGAASVTNIKSSSVTISWQTDKESTTTILYKKKGENENVIVATKSGDYTKSHNFILNGLDSNTTYEFQVKSVSGNSSQIVSNVSEFKTAILPTISDVTMDNIGFDTVTITWATNINLSSEIEYGTQSGIYQFSSADLENLITLHKTNLTGLTQGQKYYFHVKGRDQEGNLITSDEYSFTTGIAPSITDVNVNNVSESKVQVTYKTSAETSSKIEYTNTQTEEVNNVEKDLLALDHSLDISDLTPGVKYNFVIIVEDKNGNTARSKVYSFTTPEDKEGPEMNSIQTSTTLLEGKGIRVQAIFSWKTNEESNSKIEFIEGNVELPNDIKEKESDFVLNHTLVISSLQPSTVYKYVLISEDKFGNETKSNTYALLTPAKSVSIIDLIIRNLEQVFGWTNNLKK